MLINCDLGENLSPDPDPEVMPLIDLANIACGGHAGNASSIQKTLQMATTHQVQIGAHPSYPDRENFGRTSMPLDKATLLQTLEKQLTLFEDNNPGHLKLHHLKPHGALYLDMMRSESIFITLLAFMQTNYPNDYLVVQGGIDHGKLDLRYQQLAKPFKITLLFEGFADRGYQENGRLLPRKAENSLLTTPDNIIQQTNDFKGMFDTLCFHSDNPASVEALKQLGELSI